MKKILLSCLIGTVLFLTGCGIDNQNTKQNNTEPEPNQAQICSAICEDQIKELCQEEISQIESAGESLDGSIMDEASCQLMCEADWNDDILDCISEADTCAQFINSYPYCIETEIENEDAILNNPQPGNCDKACKNYSKCASYTENVTPADIEDAYNSCQEICSAWTDETINCVANTKIESPGDCVYQTACVLKDVKDMMR